MKKVDILSALDYIGIDPKDFDLKDSYFTNDIAHHRKHGKGHLYRVMIGTALIARELKEPWLGRLAFCAAFLHDQNRLNNNGDYNHGLRAAQKNFNLFTNIWDKYGFSRYEREYIQAACANHSPHDRHNYSSIPQVDMIVRDADALDRCRFFREDGRLKPHLLHFQKESRSLIKKIEEICEPTNHSFTHEITFLQFIDAATRQGEIGSLSSERVQKYAPDNIREIAENQVFVFNNTSNGCSNARTALAAYKYHGAVKGVAEGLTGQSYSIPTDGGLDNIRKCVERFLKFASDHPELEFLVTKIGCGVAGYTEADIAPFFMDAESMDNVLLPESFEKAIQEKSESVLEKEEEDTPCENRIKIVLDDITKLNVDVIVNAANEGLWAGGGVCGAIHKAAGSKLADECALMAPCKTGQAIMTGAYNIKNCKKIIHAVGPKYDEYTPEEADALLRSTYINAVEIARGRGFTSIAFPFISSGIFGYPRKKCAEVAFEALMDGHCCNIDLVMCAFSEEDYNLFVDTYKKLKNRM